MPERNSFIAFCHPSALGGDKIEHFIGHGPHFDAFFVRLLGIFSRPIDFLNADR